MAAPVLRAGAEADLPALAGIRQSVMGASWRQAGAAPECVEAWMIKAAGAAREALESGLLLVVQDGLGPQGAAHARLDGSACQLGGSMLAGHLRGLGLGARMLAVRLQWAREAGAAAAHASICSRFHASRALLQAAGFTASAPRPSLLPAGLQAIDFRLQL